MCGILGHIVFDGGSANTEAVISGLKKINHRGPDDNKFVSYPGVCLGHCRLSIIDIEGSHQPWLSADGRYTIIFNGEIYNFVELRQELEELGHIFKTTGDTEVLLTAFIQYGYDCLHKLNGMFAFAIWDKTEKKLFLARDRLGKKPLYYSLNKNSITFSSELSGLSGFREIDRTLNHRAVNDYFSHQYIGREDSIYTGIKKLRAGHFLICSKNNLSTKKYWSVPKPSKCSSKPDEISDELNVLLEDSVKLRLRSDVPLGAFLSGGLDSSIIVSLLKKLGANAESFTIGFEDSTYDETIDAKNAAEYFNTNHHSEYLDNNLVEVIDSSLKAFCEPFSDPSSIPTWMLCKYTRQHVTVALSGDGADELFCGYNRYYARKWADIVSYCPKVITNLIIEKFMEKLEEGEGYYSSSMVKKLKLFSHMLKRINETPEDPLAQTFTLSERKKILNQDLISSARFDFINEFDIYDVDKIAQMMISDLNVYLPDDILVKVDRMSMSHSLEVRSPFLDHRVVEYVSQLPSELKMKGNIQKYLLKRSFRDKIPEFILKKSKHGFSVPLNKWFRTELKTLFEATVFEEPRPDFINVDEVKRLWTIEQSGNKGNSFKLWSIFVFCHWHKMQYI